MIELVPRVLSGTRLTRKPHPFPSRGRGRENLPPGHEVSYPDGEPKALNSRPQSLCDLGQLTCLPASLSPPL